MPKKSRYYTMKDICKIIGVSKNTIINWEHWGLIRPKRDDLMNYRYWTKEDITELKRVKAMNKRGIRR